MMIIIIHSDDFFQFFRETNVLKIFSFFRNGEMSLTLELLRMETDRDLFWPYSAGNALISAVPHDCPKAAKKAANNNSSNQTLVNNNNNNNNSLSKVRAGLSTHKRHSYCKYTRTTRVSEFHFFAKFLVILFSEI